MEPSPAPTVLAQVHSTKWVLVMLTLISQTILKIKWLKANYTVGKTGESAVPTGPKAKAWMAVLVMLALRLASQTPSAFLTFRQSKPNLTDETAVSQWLAQGPQSPKSECHDREQASQGLNFLSCGMKKTRLAIWFPNSQDCRKSCQSQKILQKHLLLGHFTWSGSTEGWMQGLSNSPASRIKTNKKSNFF